MKKKIKNFYIAVDGSIASGKTTASKIISKKFKLKLISSTSVEEVILALKDLRKNFNEPQLV